MILNAEIRSRYNLTLSYAISVIQPQMAVFLRSHCCVSVFHEELGQQPLKNLLHNEIT